MKEKLENITDTCVPLPIENVDTDQIIPARFLKATSKAGFGDYLFADWRTQPDFVLNNPTYSGQILVAGQNFGSGSSREHAAWAIVGAGFRVVVSSFFADIFRNNLLNNGALPVIVSPQFLAELFASIKADPTTWLSIHLEAQTIVNHATGTTETFAINAYKKHCLTNGLDDIDYLLTNRPAIERWEAEHGNT